MPLTGQGAQGPKRFTIELMPGADPEALPKAHTCFNRIDMPRYRTYEQVSLPLFALFTYLYLFVK